MNWRLQIWNANLVSVSFLLLVSSSSQDIWHFLWHHGKWGQQCVAHLFGKWETWANHFLETHNPIRWVHFTSHMPMLMSGWRDKRMNGWMNREEVGKCGGIDRWYNDKERVLEVLIQSSGRKRRIGGWIERKRCGVINNNTILTCKHVVLDFYMWMSLSLNDLNVKSTSFNT